MGWGRLTLSLCLLSACGEDSCHEEISCSPHAGVTFRTPTDEWTAGAYELEITSGPTSARCSFEILEDNGSTTPWLDCRNFFDARFNQRVACPALLAPPNRPPCIAIPNLFDLSVLLWSTAESISLRLERDGAVLLDEMRVLEYRQSVQGACVGDCREAALELVVR
jgi:hypothetical protein